MRQFHDMGLDDRLLQAIAKLSWKEPTLIQEKAIPLILEGKDVLARARTGSGKLEPFVCQPSKKFWTSKQRLENRQFGPWFLHPIHANFKQLTAFCTRDVKVIDISTQGDLTSVKSLLNEKPDIVVSTPTRILSHSSAKSLDLKESLELLIIDEADLIFSFGFEDDLKMLLGHLPKMYQAVLASATLTEDVINLKKLVLHNPVILKLQEPLIPPSCQLSHYVIRSEEEEKFVLIYALFKLNLVRGKSLIFVNNVDRSYKLKLYLEQFGIKACVLNAELPQMSRWHTVQQFNIGVYNIIIASDDRYLNEKAPEEVVKAENKDDKNQEQGSSNPKRRRDKESGVSRGIDFQYVSNVINFDFPVDSETYIHRVGRTARGNNQGAALSFASMKEAVFLQEVETALQELSSESLTMKPFNFKMEEVEGFRYRAKDAWKAVTRIAVREARLKEIRLEIMNSQKLKGYFDNNPKEMQALRHDKALKTVKQQPHLKHVPDYIVPKTLKQLSRGKWVKNVASTSSGYIPFPQKAKKKRGKIGKGKGKKQKSDPLMSLKFDGLNKKKKRKAAD
ncbi:putative ATP-dependent RNA helicase DDX56 [Orchesella cincta]|uniref:RNA helicase n=1 Tax=Orchesella cincta TaxID=48709 RepID=A0A1D2MZJ4_ORCCI|nr:putative ATP-dependent RNA helicase DDX56 [Orchesella cincta]